MTAAARLPRRSPPCCSWSAARLITCGGAFDQATDHYVDDIVAFAHLVG
ncbi:hypothetical protein [Pedococcus ginsenosidimutans]